MANNIEIALAGKRYSIDLSPLHGAAQNEVRATLLGGESSGAVDAIALLRAYITKVQENALLLSDIDALVSSIEKRSLSAVDVVEADSDAAFNVKPNTNLSADSNKNLSANLNADSNMNLATDSTPKTGGF